MSQHHGKNLVSLQGDKSDKYTSSSILQMQFLVFSHLELSWNTHNGFVPSLLSMISFLCKLDLLFTISEWFTSSKVKALPTMCL